MTQQRCTGPGSQKTIGMSARLSGNVRAAILCSNLPQVEWRVGPSLNWFAVSNVPSERTLAENSISRPAPESVMSTAPQSVVMSVQQFCEWSSIGRTKVYEEIATHRLKTLKVGRRRLIKRDEAQRWLDSHGSEAAA